MQIGAKAMKNPDEAGAASFDYMMYSGYVVLAYFWAKMAITARTLLDKQVLDKQLVNDQPLEDVHPKELLENKIANATFYFARILPRAISHKVAMLSGNDSLKTSF